MFLGQILDTSKIVIPGPVNSLYGKIDYVLGNVPNSVASAGKGGTFRGLLGFDESNVGEALTNQLEQNFSHGVMNGNKIEVTAPITGPNGVTANIKSVWQVQADGTVNFVTALLGPHL